MPYEWIAPNAQDSHAPKVELHLWPYRSLPRRGFVWIMGMGFALALLPLLGLLGSMLLWGVLPFLLLALGALWFFIEKSYRDGEVLEDLRIWIDRIELTRHGPKGAQQSWSANPYWVTVHMHPAAGPVANYVTLKGDGREVEIGAFLSEDERPALFDDLCRTLNDVKTLS